MKFTNLLPLAALGAAFVIVDEAVLEKVAIETKPAPQDVWDMLPSKDDLASSVKSAAEYTESAFDKAISYFKSEDEDLEASFGCHPSVALSELGYASEDESEDDPHRRPPHRRRPHHGKPNHTIWELINHSKYTTRLAKLIGEYDDLVDLLNGTSANFTLFAPTDKAFEHLPDHKKPDKQTIKNILTYHVSPHFYPAKRILFTHTIPSAYHEIRLGDEPQRLRVGISLFKGLTINFFSKVVAANIFATNGVIHGVDHLLIPPPAALKIVELLPGEFSTLQLALEKTGLFDKLKDASHTGGTLFAPTNDAFKKLGPRINAFLFSSRGEKYLTALLKYHVVANETLYSDAFYKAKSDESAEDMGRRRFHVDLPTLLDDKSLSIDIARWGRFIEMKINGFNRVAVQDAIAADGVVQVLSNVLIPPKTPHGGFFEEGEELTVEDLMGRLEAHVEEKKQGGWFDWDL